MSAFDVLSALGFSTTTMATLLALPSLLPAKRKGRTLILMGMAFCAGTMVPGSVSLLVGPILSKM